MSAVPHVSEDSDIASTTRARDERFRMFSKQRLNPLAAMVDQAWLSLLSFAISAAFIRGASKAEYGYYLLLVAPLMLMQGIQNALVNSPLVTFLPAASESDKPLLRRTATSLHVYVALAGSALGAIGITAYGHWSVLQIDAALVAGFSFAIIGTIAREAQRSFAYVQGQGIRALAGDLVYGVVLLGGIGLAVVGHRLTAAVVLFLTGLAGVLPLLPQWSGLPRLPIHAESLRQFWSCGRWALPAVIATWINLSAYPYFAERSLGLSAVADIGAARLLLMPIGLAMAAWSNWYRPRISAWLAANDAASVIRLTRISLWSGWAVLALLAAALLAAYPYVETILGDQYLGLRPLVLMWLVCFALSLARGAHMATLMTDAHGYKLLHHMSWLVLAVALPCFVLLAHNGALWVVGVLCVLEAIQLLFVVFKTRHYWRRVAGPPSTSRHEQRQP